MRYSVYDIDTGHICKIVDCLETDLHLQFDQSTQGYISQPVDNSHYIHEGVAVKKQPRPTPHHIFNYATKQWEDPRTLDDLKAAQWTLIKQARSQAEYAGFTWDGSTFDSDAISQSRITGVVTLANLAKQLEQPYSITWTLADNSTRTLSADEMILVGLALGQHVQTNFNKGQQLYEQIQQAITKEEVEAVLWPN